jgi:putative NIF3 family GTP cyclohydrolase 1 type 2
VFLAPKRLHARDPRQRAALQAYAAGITVYSPHTALDAAPGGVADWLCEGLLSGAAPKSLEPCGEGEFGRVVELTAPVALARLLPRIKRRLGARTLRAALLAAGTRQRVRRIAVAAGSGGSVLRGARADLWVTGELSHHDALAAVAAGTSVVVGEHSDTERGYLRVLQRRLRTPFEKGLDVRISKADRDPFAFV